MPGLGGGEYAAVAALVLVGAFVQGSIGFAFALIAAPLLAIVEPEAVPVTILLLALPINAVVLGRERGSVDAPGAAQIVVGMVAGTILAVPVLLAVPERFLAVLFGVGTLAGVGAAALHPGGEAGAAARVAAGAGSGLINTIASTGGPLVALLYQRRAGPVLRATLALTFLVSVFLSLGGQAVAGRLAWWQVRLAAVLLPALVAGLWASSRGARLLDRRWARPAVLSVAACSGVAAIIQGVL